MKEKPKIWLTSWYCFFFLKQKNPGYDSLSAIRYPFQFENAGSARDKFHHWTAATAAALFINS